MLALSGEQTDLANGHLARISLRLERPADARLYLDRIHDAGFDALKAKFLSQAARLEARPAAPPSIDPAGND